MRSACRRRPRWSRLQKAYKQRPSAATFAQFGTTAGTTGTRPPCRLVFAASCEIARVLRPGGVATVHHAGRRERRARRGPMSALLFANLARERGLEVERLFDSWGRGRHDVKNFGDVITVLRRPLGAGLRRPDGEPGGG